MESRKTVRLTGEDGHYFFGYYDLNAWDKGNNYHLCQKKVLCDIRVITTTYVTKYLFLTVCRGWKIPLLLE